MKADDIIDGAAEALSSCLAGIPGARIESVDREVQVPSGGRADLVVRARMRGERRTLVVEVKSSGQPRSAREAIAQLKSFASAKRLREAYPVFAAPYISERSGEMCREAGVGYFDLAGNCLLNMPDAYVEKRVEGNPYREKRESASLFSPKSSRILRVMLDDPQRAWRIQELAENANVSIGLASRIKERLREQEWAEWDRAGVRLTAPEALLQAWSDAYRYTDNEVQEFYSLGSPAEIESKVADQCRENGVRYALTGFSGARLVAPRVRYNRATIYVSTRAESVSLNAGLKPVDTGANCLLLRPYDDGVYQGARDLYDATVVSPVQLYLDLVSMSGRGEEAAEEILRKELRPKWS